MSEIIAGVFTSLIRQPNGLLTVNKESIAKAYESYVGPYILCGTSIQFLIDTPHPDFPSLLVYDKKLKRRRGTTIAGDRVGQIDVEYRGVDPSVSYLDSLPPPVYSMERSTSEDPIDSHKKFITDIGGTAAAPINGAKFDPVTGIFTGFDSTSPFRGQESYLIAGKVWTKTYLSYSSPSSGEESQVGFIDSPDGGPATPSGRDWLYLGLSSSKEGGIYRLQKSWLLSGPKGWNNIVYTT